MPRRLYKGEPLTPDEREAYERDLISFCDRELDLLGDIHGLAVLYAGGSSPLWLEGLSQRIGRTGTLVALEADTELVEEGRELLREADLAAPVRIFASDVFRPPFEGDAFDLAYSAGLFHEVDVCERSAKDALAALACVVRTGGRVATSDFVDSVPAVQLEDEELQRELVWELTGAKLYGIGPSERLIALHEALLDDTRWRISAPHLIRYLDKVILAEEEPQEILSLSEEARRRLRERRRALRERIRREGYTRPGTLYVEGVVMSTPEAG
jgi:ubiquinone/menaquinone biosynthesis C-methylase UbiE